MLFMTINKHCDEYPRIGLNTSDNEFIIMSFDKLYDNHYDKTHICVVRIPKGIRMFHAGEIIIEKIMPLWDIYTIQYLILKTKPHNIDCILRNACKYGHLDVVQYLVGIGAMTDNRYYLSLSVYYASQFGHLDVVKYLTSMEVAIHSSDYAYALYFISKKEQFDVVKYIVSPGSLLCASRSGHLNVVKYLVSVGANIHHALYEASSRGHLEVVKYLVSIDTNVHENRYNALRVAKKEGHINVVEYLNSIGA